MGRTILIPTAPLTCVSEAGSLRRSSRALGRDSGSTRSHLGTERL